MDDKKLELLIALEGADAHWLSQLVAYRKLKGFTQQDVAERMGIRQSNVSRLENLNTGKKRKHSDILTRYAEAVGVYVGHIVVDGESDYEALDAEISHRLRDLHRAVQAKDRGEDGLSEGDESAGA